MGKTKTGIVYRSGNFHILENPYTGEQVEKWLENNAFHNEYEAGLALHIYLAQMKLDNNVEYDTNESLRQEKIRFEFRNTLKFTLRMLGIKSVWAE